MIGELIIGKFGDRQARFRQAPFAELAERNSASPVYSFLSVITGNIFQFGLNYVWTYHKKIPFSFRFTFQERERRSFYKTLPN